MKKMIIIVISFILTVAITISIGLKNTNELLLFGIINALFIWLGFYFSDRNSLKNRNAQKALINNDYMKDHELKNHFKKILDNSIELNDALESIKAGAIESGKASELIAFSTQKIVEQNNEQLSIVDETTYNSKKITEMIESAAEFADSANKAAEASMQVSIEAGKAVKKTVETMKKIERTAEDTCLKINTLTEKSKRIGDIISFITSIASQTNLLALNAAIEAARAGEQGGGFAIVADEVRKLAEQSNTAASEISCIIKEIIEDIKSSSISVEQVTSYVSEGVAVTNAAGNSLEEILEAFRKSAKLSEEIQQLIDSSVANCHSVFSATEKNQVMAYATAKATKEIAAASEEQNGSIEEINSSIDVITELSEETKQNVASAVMDKLMYKKALQLCDRIVKDKSFDGSVKTMKVLSEELGVDEVDITDSKGFIRYSSLAEAIGINLFDIKLEKENCDLIKSLFVDKMPYVTSKLKISTQTGKLYKFMIIGNSEKQNVYQVALSYESLLKLLEE